MTESHTLSNRELEILELVATGASNKEIAEELSISSNTVKVHLKNIFVKIGVSSRTEAALYAVRNDLFTEVVALQPTTQSNVGPRGPRTQSAVGGAQISQKRNYWNITLATVGIVLLGIVGMFIVLQLDGSSGENGEILGIGPVSDRIQIRSELPTPRSGFAIVNHENKIFTIAGKGENGVTGKVERYDPQLDEWVELPPKPTPVTDIHAAVVGGLIYVPGGFVENEGPINALEVFDPQRGVWETRSAMPVALSAYSLVEFEGKLYIFGGWDGDKYSDIALSYDPQTDTWIELSPLPTPRGYAGGVEAGGTLYVIGGYDGTNALRVSEVYVPQLENGVDNPWRQLSPLPDPRYGYGIANVADIIHVIGGIGDELKLTSYKYVPQNDEWQAFDFPQTENWAEFGVVQIETDLYLVGGSSKGEPAGWNMRFQVMFSVLLPVVQ